MIKYVKTLIAIVFFLLGSLCAVASLVTLFFGPFGEAITLMFVMAMCYVLFGVISEHL